jgi:uncharacterized protein (TIGR02271 family)
MTLIKINDFYPDYKELFGGRDFKGYDVHAGKTDERIGHVYDLLVDESGRLRYFVVDTGFWIFGKKVLLPVGLSRLNHEDKIVYAFGISNKQQVETLPEYNEQTLIDYDYEERVRAGYRTPETSALAPYNPDSYNYDYDKKLYELNEKDHQNLKLYEERLVAHKNRYKTGEVVIGKKVTTETARTSVPIEKERVIIEHTTPRTEQAVAPGEACFQSGEVARMEVYEETAEIRKEAFVREEVNIKKEIERDTVSAEEELRHEELEIKGDDKMTLDRR